MKHLFANIDVQDVCLVLALILLGAGAGLIYLPAGLIVVGLALGALAVWRM
jgi:hypothetical protein